MLAGPARRESGPGEKAGVVLPAPLRSRPGLGGCSANGPAAILASLKGENNPRIESLLSRIELAPALDFRGLDQSGAVSLIQESLSPWLGEDRFVLLIGGEHTVTLGATRALQERGERFGVVYLDAHADLKSGIGSCRLTHATVARRLFEDGLQVFGLGWRSFDAREYEFWRRNYLRVCPSEEVMLGSPRLGRVFDSLPEKVYLSIDVDVLDPAVMPATAAPEPDGISLEALNSLIKTIFSKRRVIGADLVELSPLAGRPGPDLTAAWLGLRVLEMGLSQPALGEPGSGVLPFSRTGLKGAPRLSGPALCPGETPS